MWPRVWILSGLLVLSAAFGYTASPWAAIAAAPAQNSGWTIPASAATERNPLEVTDKVLDEGRKRFRANCSPCHGTDGTGNGPLADPPGYAPADLTTSIADPASTDGLLFYKIWNGKRDPKMPAFKTDLTRDEVWQVVAYLRTLGQ